MSIELAELLAPISPDRPCGEDVSFSDVYDRVREARRADDPSLRQGEWQPTEGCRLGPGDPWPPKC